MKIREILLGVAIGDAFGAGVEFQDRHWIREHVDFTKFVNVRNKIQVPIERLHVFTDNYTEWDYTDDTEMTIGLLKALMSTEEFTEELLIRKWEEEYNQGVTGKGFGRNGHGSMRWYYSGEKSIDEIRKFQKDRINPGNAPAMRSVPIGLVSENLINKYAEINARSTHPNICAILSSQCIARASEYLIVKGGNPDDLIHYCRDKVELNDEFESYLDEVDNLDVYQNLTESDYRVLCGNQPIEKPYFLSGINGVPSDSKYTAGSVLFILKNCKDAMDALMKSIKLEGDVDSVASITTGIMAGVSGLSSLPVFMLNNVEGLKYFDEIAIDYKRSE